MVDDAIDDAPVEAQGRFDVDLRAVTATTNLIVKADRARGWTAATKLDLGSLAWTPHALGTKQAVLHVALIERLPRYLGARLRAAHAAGWSIHVAVSTAVLYTPDWLDLLVEVDSFVYVVDDLDRSRRHKRRHVLAALADLQVPVSPEQRRRLGGITLRMLDAGSAQAKGRRLEALLAFLFGQVTDFRVRLRNHRNKSQEIDLVLQIDTFSNRVWQIPGKPLVLVEAKNEKIKTGAPVLGGFVRKIQTKHQTVKIGFLVSVAGATSDLEIESVRGSTEDHCVVVIGPDRLRELVDSADLDATLEGYVVRAFVA